MYAPNLCLFYILLRDIQVLNILPSETNIGVIKIHVQYNNSLRHNHIKFKSYFINNIHYYDIRYYLNWKYSERKHENVSIISLIESAVSVQIECKQNITHTWEEIKQT